MEGRKMSSKTTNHPDKKNVTQMHYARQGIITEEMKFVAEQEGLKPELIRSEVERGRMIIPANINHANLEPIGIGIASRTKVNANIGNSAITSNIEEELGKLCVAIRWGADTVMDLSTGGDLDLVMRSILAQCTVPLGTVPVYRIAQEGVQKHGFFGDVTVDEMFAVIERQAQTGVDL